MTPRTDERSKALAARRRVEKAAPVEPWNFWDPPFTYRTEQLPTLIIFLTDAAAMEYEITGVTAHSMTLRLTDRNSELFYTVRAGTIPLDEARRLCRMLKAFPQAMPKATREKLAGYVVRFLLGESCT